MAMTRGSDKAGVPAGRFPIDGLLLRRRHKILLFHPDRIDNAAVLASPEPSE
jgi:hypothetical protein